MKVNTICIDVALMPVASNMNFTTTSRESDNLIKDKTEKYLRRASAHSRREHEGLYHRDLLKV